MTSSLSSQTTEAEGRVPVPSVVSLSEYRRTKGAVGVFCPIGHKITFGPRPGEMQVKPSFSLCEDLLVQQNEVLAPMGSIINSGNRSRKDSRYNDDVQATARPVTAACMLAHACEQSLDNEERWRP